MPMVAGSILACFLSVSPPVGELITFREEQQQTLYKIIVERNVQFVFQTQRS